MPCSEHPRDYQKSFTAIVGHAKSLPRKCTICNTNNSKVGWSGNTETSTEATGTCITCIGKHELNLLPSGYVRCLQCSAVGNGIWLYKLKPKPETITVHCRGKKYTLPIIDAFLANE